MRDQSDWMGMPPRVINTNFFFCYVFYCSEGHDEVSWRVNEPVSRCWLCDYEHRKKIAVPS